MNHVDPPDLALWPTLRRLFPLWWDERRMVLVAVACAFAYTALSLSLPIIVQQVIDDAIVGRTTDRLRADWG